MDRSTMGPNLDFFAELFAATRGTLETATHYLIDGTQKLEKHLVEAVARRDTAKDVFQEKEAEIKKLSEEYKTLRDLRMKIILSDADFTKRCRFPFEIKRSRSSTYTVTSHARPRPPIDQDEERHIKRAKLDEEDDASNTHDIESSSESFLEPKTL